MVHGFAANARMWNSPTQKRSLPRYLCEAGYPVYVIDLRNRRDAGLPVWDMDDYVLYDIPCALNYIAGREETPLLHWIGHSMGGMLAYMFQTLGRAHRLVSVTTLGSPGLRVQPAGARHISASKSLLQSLLRPAPDQGRLDLIPPSLIGAVLALNFMSRNPLGGSVSRSSFAAMLSGNYMGNVSKTEARQLTSIVEGRGLHSRRFRFNYALNCHRITAPLLVFAGDKDRIAPRKLVEQGYTDAWAKSKKFIPLGRRFGQKASYGHMELIMGHTCEQDIWPKLLEWLEESRADRMPITDGCEPDHFPLSGIA